MQGLFHSSIEFEEDIDFTYVAFYTALLIYCRNTLKIMLDIIQLVKTELIKKPPKLRIAVGPECSAVSDYGYSLGKLWRHSPLNGNMLQYFTKFNFSGVSTSLKSDCQPALISSVKIKQFKALFI